MNLGYIPSSIHLLKTGENSVGATFYRCSSGLGISSMMKNSSSIRNDKSKTLYPIKQIKMHKNYICQIPISETWTCFYEDDAISTSLCAGSTMPSKKMNFFVAPKMLAICRTTVWHAEALGWRDVGRDGMHSGWNSFFPEDGANSVNTARQNKNLQTETET